MFILKCKGYYLYLNFFLWCFLCNFLGCFYQVDNLKLQFLILALKVFQRGFFLITGFQIKFFILEATFYLCSLSNLWHKLISWWESSYFHQSVCSYSNTGNAHWKAVHQSAKTNILHSKVSTILSITPWNEEFPHNSNRFWKCSEW